jgi:hypothetical protein
LLQHPREAQYLLSSVAHESGKELLAEEIPSWVPRYDGHRSIAFPMAGPTYWYRVSGQCDSSQFQHLVRRRPGLLPILEVSAFRVDSITWLSDTLFKHNFNLDPINWDDVFQVSRKSCLDSLWGELLGQVEEHVKQADRLAQLEVDFALVLSGGLPLSDLSGANIAEQLEHFRAYRDLACSAANPENPQQPSFADTSSIKHNGNPNIFQLFVYYCEGYRLAYTKSERIALAPAVARLDDICSTIPGLSVPFVLRPTENDTYNMVGGCYLQGIMTGELVESEQHDLILEKIMIE